MTTHVAASVSASGAAAFLIVVAGATLAGAWLSRRGGRSFIWFGIAAGALLVIGLAHLLPDAWEAATDSGVSGVWMLLTAAVAFLVTTGVSRIGCACDSTTAHAGGFSAAALAVHRLLEGVAIALAGPAFVIGISVHALSEGISVGAMLRSQPRRLLGWLAIMCLAPAAGVVLGASVAGFGVAEPLLLAAAAGILTYAATMSLRAALPHPSERMWDQLGSREVMATVASLLGSATVTALAVYAVG